MNTIDEHSQAATHRKERLWSSTFLLIIVCAFCAFVVAQGLNSGTTVYLDRIGMPTVYAGILGAAFSVAAAAGRLAVGPIVDAYGRMKAATCGALILLVGTSMPLVSSDMTLLTLARILQGIGFSVVATAAATAAVDVLPKSRLGEGVGYFGLAQSFAFVFGPAFALFLVSLEPSSIVFAGLTVVSAFVLIFSFPINYEKNPENLPHGSTYWLRFQNGAVPYAKPHERISCRREKKLPIFPLARKRIMSAGTEQAAAENNNEEQRRLRGESFLGAVFDKHALPGAIPMLVLSPVYGFGIFFMGLYGSSIDIPTPGLFFSISAVTMIISRATSGHYMNNASLIKVYAVAIACGIISYGLIIGASNYTLLYYVAGVFYGASLGLSFPVLSAIAVRNTKPARWGVANAMVGVATDIGIGFSAILWGLIKDTAGFIVTLHAIVALFIVAFAIAYVMFPKASP